MLASLFRDHLEWAVGHNTSVKAPRLDAAACSLHAKCVAVDGERAFVSSANFTARAQERNIEAGVLINDATFAGQLDRQWMSLIEGGFVFRRQRPQ